MLKKAASCQGLRSPRSRDYKHSSPIFECWILEIQTREENWNKSQSTPVRSRSGVVMKIRVNRVGNCYQLSSRVQIAAIKGRGGGGGGAGGSMAAGLTFVWPPPASHWRFLDGWAEQWSPHINTDWLRLSLFKASIVSEFRLIWRCRLEMHWPDLLEDDLYW